MPRLPFFRVTTLVLLATGCFYTPGVRAQASQTVSEVITTFNGYWKSGFNAVNPLKPTTSHNLLAFTFSGTRYSTGVNDELLNSQGDGDCSPQIFQALPVLSITGTVTSNTKVALGQLYDGVNNGPSNPPPVNDLPFYLTDGAAGLDLGTGVANLPAGDLKFNILSINPSAIGDGIPDILITQIADPSNGTDTYEFTTSSDVTVGNTVNISFSGINAVGNWTGDFYEASSNPMILTPGFTNSDRPLRLWAADFSYFGITTGNYTAIKKFKIRLNGNSDVGFIAYNMLSTYITLPTVLSYFHSSQASGNIILNWQTKSENSIHHFEIETSYDGQHFNCLGMVAGKGIGSMQKDYHYVHSNAATGPHYYRLMMVDKDGKHRYSNILKETVANSANATVYPNPARGTIVLKHPVAKAGDKLQLFSELGKSMLIQNIIEGSTETKVNLTPYSKGNYFFLLNTQRAIKETIKFTIY